MSKKIKIKNDNRDVVVSDINRLYEIDADYPPLVDDNRRIFVDNLTLNEAFKNLFVKRSFFLNVNNVKFFPNLS